MRGVRVVLTVALVVGLVVLANLYWQPLIVHLSQETGSSNEASRSYAFWSGFGSDIGEVTIITGIVLTLRHHTCHVKGCLRLGKPVDGTPYVACPKHHPEHEGEKRGISLETLHLAHENRRR